MSGGRLAHEWSAASGGPSGELSYAEARKLAPSCRLSRFAVDSRGEVRFRSVVPRDAKLVRVPARDAVRVRLWRKHPKRLLEVRRRLVHAHLASWLGSAFRPVDPGPAPPDGLSLQTSGLRPGDRIASAEEYWAGAYLGALIYLQLYDRAGEKPTNVRLVPRLRLRYGQALGDLRIDRRDRACRYRHQRALDRVGSRASAGRLCCQSVRSAARLSDRYV